MHRFLTHATLTKLNGGFPHNSQKIRHSTVWEALKKSVCTTLTYCVIFNIKKGVGERNTVFHRDFILCFLESSHTSVEQWSKHYSWHPSISCYQTCDSWPTISEGLHSPQCDGGRRRNVKSIKGCKNSFCTLYWHWEIRGLYRWWQVHSIKRCDFNSLMPFGCLGQLGIQKLITTAFAKTCFKDLRNVCRLFWERSAEHNVTQESARAEK